MSKIIISLKEVSEYLSEDTKCSKEKRQEVIDTLQEIEAKEGRKWIFTPDRNRYYIDEYNEYNDFVKTYTFNNED
jgi:hypothetical protein